ncbi:MAG: zinc metalloprotease HtpX [Methanosarcinales archaeon]|nr:zinc metalloprotease HtpX [ANME-2 cluster archaeon]MDW7776784.1 zinc metalloprotease HtpX [Methanosarcinales archaeon]
MRKWNTDWGLQGRMLFTMFLLAAVYLFFLAFLSYYSGNMTTMILFIGGFMFIQYFLSDKLVLMSMGAKVVSESEEPRLHEMISRLCAMADIHKPRVAVVNSSVPNAFATGRSPKKAVVAVTTGIMKTLTSSELEAVIAHELSHIKNRDVMVMTIASFLSTVAFFLVRYLLFFGGGNRDRQSGGIMAVWLVSILVWVISLMLIRTLSRYREFSADRGSALITGAPSHLASALMKISGIMPRIPTDDLRKVEGMNAFFIIPALSGSSIMHLFSTHPSVEKRIAALEKLETELEM